MDHIVMEATALGLATCWIANFDSIAASEIIGLGEGFEPIVFTNVCEKPTPLGVGWIALAR